MLSVDARLPSKAEAKGLLGRGLGISFSFATDQAYKRTLTAVAPKYSIAVAPKLGAPQALWNTLRVPGSIYVKPRATLHITDAPSLKDIRASLSVHRVSLPWAQALPGSSLNGDTARLVDRSAASHSPLCSWLAQVDAVLSLGRAAPRSRAAARLSDAVRDLTLAETEVKAREEERHERAATKVRRPACTRLAAPSDVARSLRAARLAGVTHRAARRTHGGPSLTAPGAAPARGADGGAAGHH